MTVRAARIASGDLNVQTVNRALIEFAGSVDAAILALLLAGAVLLEVPAAEASTAFTFPTSRRIYSQPGPQLPGTSAIRIFNSGETIIRHPLGRVPTGRIIVGQAASSILFDLDVSTLTPALNPSEYVAYRSSSATTYKLVLF